MQNRVLGGSWATPGSKNAALRFWMPLGSHFLRSLAPSWRSWRRSERLLDPSLGILGRLGPRLGAHASRGGFGTILGPSWREDGPK